MAYASGKRSLAICDRCGFRYSYPKLVKEWTGFRVCQECYEPKHPQLIPPKNVSDPEALRHPRPQQAVTAGEGVVRTIDPNRMISTTGDPIGSAFSGLKGTTELGSVTVVIS